jgi:hypothetical protein
MDTTLLSATNSSSCSRRDGGMCALTVLVRFSLRMEEEAPAANGTDRRGKTRRDNQEEENAAEGGNAHCP